MSKSVLIFLMIQLLSSVLFAQSGEEELSKQLIDEVNLLRQSANLQPLEEDEVLHAAAFDQAEYISETEKLEHIQDNKKKKTLVDRILYFEGLHAEAGENIAMVTIGSKAIIEPNGQKVSISNEEMAIKAALTAWLEDTESSRLNLFDPAFFKVGAAVLVKEEKQLTFVLLTSSLPYVNPGVKKLPTDFHGIKPYNESCKTFLTDHPTLPELFSDVVKVESGEAFLEYHNVDFIKEILSESSDGIALDVIQRSQLNCKEGNRLFPGSINSGYLMPPIGKGKLATQNLKAIENKVKISLGRLPDFYNAEEDELNLVLIKKGHHCETVPFNNIKVENKRWFNLPFILIGQEAKTWNDTTTFTYTLNDNAWEEKWEQDKKALKQLNYTINTIETHLMLSPSYQQEIIDSLINKKVSNGKGELGKKVVWEDVTEYTNGSYYQLDLAELDSEEEKINYLIKSAQSDKALSDFLEELNKIKITVTGKASIKENFSIEEVLDLYTVMITNERIEGALILQSELISKVTSGELQAEEIPLVDPSQQKNSLALINNQIVLEQSLGADLYGGNPMHLALLELHLIDKAQTEINFNYHIAQLEHWTQDLHYISGFDQWLKEMKALSGKGIPLEKYAKAMFNYYVLAVDYYYEKEAFDERKKAFTELMNWQEKADLANREALNLAKYLCFQDQFSLAIKVLLPRLKEGVSKELLFYFLQIAQYDQELVSQDLYEDKMGLLFESYPSEACSLFTREKMGIQALKNTKIKKLFCEECEL